MIYILTLERRPVREMPELIQALIQNSNYYWKVMTNVWLIDSNLDSKKLFAILKQKISSNDLLFIIQVQDNYDGNLDQETWRWLINSSINNDFTNR